MDSSYGEAAIQALYQQKIEGWNAGNGNAFAAPYTEDSDYIVFDDTYLKGHQEIASFHQILFDKFLKGSHLVGKIRSIRFPTSDIAIIVAVGGTVMVEQSDIDPERNSSYASCYQTECQLAFHRISKLTGSVYWKTRGSSGING